MKRTHAVRASKDSKSRRENGFLSRVHTIVFRPSSPDCSVITRQESRDKREALMSFIGCRTAVIAIVTAVLLQQAFAEPPKFEVDPTWPQTLPSNWIIGTIGGIFVDAQDHIWINQRPSSLDAREKRA